MECDAALAEERAERQRHASLALEAERVRRVTVLREVEERTCSARQMVRSRAVAEMEQERQRRLYEIAVRQYEMAVGMAKPGTLTPPPKPQPRAMSPATALVPTAAAAGAPAAADAADGLGGGSDDGNRARVAVVAAVGGDDDGDDGGSSGEEGENASSSRRRQSALSRQLQWAAFASGVAAQLGRKNRRSALGDVSGRPRPHTWRQSSRVS